MKNIIAIKFFCLFFTAATILFMQPVYGQSVKPLDVVGIRTVVKYDSLKSSGLVLAKIILEIKKGWHINANKPLDDNLTPTSISLKSQEDFDVVKISYPLPLLKKLSFSDSQLALYEDQISIDAVLKMKKKKLKNNLVVHGEVQYQPCNDQTCLFPVAKAFEIKIKLK